MNRKKAVLLTSVVNAAFLLALFVASLFEEKNVEEEISYRQKPEIVPHYTEPFVQIESEARSHLPIVAQNKEEKVQHLLPPLAEPVTALPIPLPEPLVVKEEAPIVAAALPEKVSVKEPVIVVQEIVVQKGDNLEKIAKKYQTSVDALLKENMLSNTLLKVGQKLKIPPPSNTQKKNQAPSFTPEGAEYYTMKVGDNPWSIAMKHHLKVDELLKLNGLNEEKARKLKPGDRLRIR